MTCFVGSVGLIVGSSTHHTAYMDPKGYPLRGTPGTKAGDAAHTRVGTRTDTRVDTTTPWHIESIYPSTHALGVILPKLAYFKNSKQKEED